MSICVNEPAGIQRRQQSKSIGLDRKSPFFSPSKNRFITGGSNGRSGCFRGFRFTILCCCCFFCASLSFDASVFFLSLCWASITRAEIRAEQKENVNEEKMSTFFHLDFGRILSRLGADSNSKVFFLLPSLPLSSLFLLRVSRVTRFLPFCVPRFFRSLSLPNPQ